jgi:hypothetical protein
VEVPPVPKRKVAALAVLGALVLGGAAALVVPPIQHGKEKGARQERRAQAASERAERRRLARDQRVRRGRSGPGVDSAALVHALERAITRDARGRARRGELAGPILRTTCERLHVGSEARLERVLGRYSCLAVKSEDRSVRGYPFEVGYDFIATVHFRERSYVWCKLNLRPGEGATHAATAVKPSRACAGPYRNLL